MQRGTVGRVRMFENKWQISQAFNPANLHFSAWFLLFLCPLLHLCQVFAKSPRPIFNCDRARYWNNKSKVTPVRLVGRVWSTVPVQLSTRSSRQAGSSVSSGENFSPPDLDRGSVIENFSGATPSVWPTSAVIRTGSTQVTLSRWELVNLLLAINLPFSACFLLFLCPLFHLCQVFTLQVNLY